MLDGFFEAIARTLSVFYDLIPNYAVAIAMLTFVVMLLTTPLTLKGTRSMLQMQRLQPEMKRIQQKYRDDRQKMNEELMRLYQEEGMSPFGGCLPMLLQAPVFIILFNVIRGLANRPGDSITFVPKYLDEGSKLFRDLSATDQMMAFGVDLAESASSALSAGFIHGLPHLAMVSVVAISSYVQQKQIQGRNPNAEVPPQQKMLMRIFPAMFVVIAFVSPAGLVVYFVTSNVYRIGVQAYITHTLYGGDDSPGAKARKAAEESRQLREAEKAGNGDAAGKGDDDKGKEAARETTATDATPRSNGSGRSGSNRPKPTSRTGAQNRSKKKRRRR